MLLTATCSNLWEVETLEYLFSGHFLGTENELNRKAQDALLTSETTNLSLIDQHNVLAPNSISVIAPTPTLSWFLNFKTFGHGLKEFSGVRDVYEMRPVERGDQFVPHRSA